MKDYSVSVCICTYNQAAYIETSIRSVVAQTLTPFEIIVADDCSTDSTSQILDALMKEIKSLKVVRHSTNLGIAKNVDFCLRMAKGELILRLDSDDYLHPRYIERVSGAMITNPNAGYGHTAIQEVDEQGKYLRERKLFRRQGIQTDVEALKAALSGYRVAANILMFRKSALEIVNFMNGRPNFGEDYHLTTSIAAAGFGNIYIPETLAFYRVWTDPAKIRQKRKLDEISGLRRVFEDVIEPAYLERDWRLRPVAKGKAQLASNHTDCLSWSIFDDREKRRILAELMKFSSAPQVKLLSWMHMNRLGGLLTGYNSIKHQLKSSVKKVIKRNNSSVHFL